VADARRKVGASDFRAANKLAKSVAASYASRLAGLGIGEVPGMQRNARRRRRQMEMTDRTIDLDQHRGMAAQKATELRRVMAEVEADAQALRVRQDALEAQLISAPAGSWPEAAGKARYLLGLFAATAEAQDPRRQKLIANVLDDFPRLSSGGAPPSED
jgi:hypothetical protein